MYVRFILFLLLSISLFAEKTDVLFYVQDAGETFALMPVMKELEKRSIDYRVLTAGVASDLVKKGKIPPERVRSFRTLVDQSWGRSQLITEEEISWLTQEIEAVVVVAEVAFELQGQVLKAYREQGARACAYWDSFHADRENLYFATAHSVEPRAEFLLLPSDQLAKSGAFSHRNPSDMIVVGHPSLQEWEREASQIDLGKVRGQLGLCPCQKVAVYVGGYGDDYREAFLLFLQSLESLKNSEYHFLIQPHPKFGGAVEREILAHYPHQSLPIQLLEGEISTAEAVALADLVVCYQSSVGFQAFALEKQVIYLIPPSQSFDCLPLQKGLATRVFFPTDFESALHLQSSGSGFYELLGVPRDGVSLLVQTIEKLCQTTKNDSEKFPLLLNSTLQLF